MKRIAIFCDGTWNKLSSPHPTNVVKLAEAVSATDAAGNAQVVYYDEGVGAGTPVLRHVDQFMGGAFGIGLMRNVEEAYRFLTFNYCPGDEVYIFGFSRGAYTARTLAGLIRNCSIIDRGQARTVHKAIDLYRSRSPDGHPDAPKSCEFRAEFAPDIYVSERDLEWRRTHITGFDATSIKPLHLAYIGVWDTVGALGIPKHIIFQDLLNQSQRFHDAKLSSMTKSARHALALDEARQVFAASPWDEEKLELLNAGKTGTDAPFRQEWFPGDHGSVGGGGDIVGLSDGALLWIAEGAERAGLKLEPDRLSAFKPDHRSPLKNTTDEGFGVLTLASKKPRPGPQLLSHVSQSAIARWDEDASALPEEKLYRPASLGRVKSALEARR